MLSTKGIRKQAPLRPEGSAGSGRDAPGTGIWAVTLGCQRAVLQAVCARVGEFVFARVSLSVSVCTPWPECACV